jgi:hypothetical protein
VGVFDSASATTFPVLDVVPPSISLAQPTNEMHGNTDDSDVEPDTIAATHSAAEVSALIAARPFSDTVPG